MQRHPLYLMGSVLAFVSMLFVATACGSDTTVPAAQTTSTPTAVKATPTPTIPETPSQSVTFKTKDNVKLAGLLFGKGKTAVICSHELNTTKAIWSTSTIVQLLASRGYMVLAYDFRGNGESEGQGDLTKLDVDLRAAIAFAQEQGASKVLLMGSSMGGTATIKVAASEQVAGIITLSAPQNFGPGVSDDEVTSIKAPKLFVNSQDDDYAGETQHMYDIAVQPKELHMYSGSLHGTAILDSDDGDNLRQMIVNFATRYAPVSA